jgi:class 3 adenylate cyclase
MPQNDRTTEPVDEPVQPVARAKAQGLLPPAHVGLHAGPVLFQEGDYFGQTVNLTARIADYRPARCWSARQ